MKKVFVDVVASNTVDGQIIPLKVLWEDGREFEIDRVLEVKKAASINVGGIGIRYKCRINGKETYIFLDSDKWFVEGK